MSKVIFFFWFRARDKASLKLNNWFLNILKQCTTSTFKDYQDDKDMIQKGHWNMNYFYENTRMSVYSAG